MRQIQRNLWVIFAALSLVACPDNSQGTRAAPPNSPVASPQPSAKKSAETLDYVEFVTGGAASEDRLPMVVAIHGLGDSPEGFAGLLRGLDQPARVILPRGPEPWRRGFSWFSIRGADWADGPWVEGVRRSATRLAALITDLQRKRPTVGKPLVTGFSQGGILSFTLAILHPQAVGMAVPIGGFLPTSLVPEKGADMAGVPPIVALNGEADTIIPFHLALTTMKQLKPLGVKIRLQGYPDVRHQVPPRIRAELFVEAGGYLSLVVKEDREKK